MGVEGVDRVSYQEEAIQRRDGCVGEVGLGRGGWFALGYVIEELKDESLLSYLLSFWVVCWRRVS